MLDILFFLRHTVHYTFVIVRGQRKKSTY